MLGQKPLTGSHSLTPISGNAHLTTGWGPVGPTPCEGLCGEGERKAGAVADFLADELGVELGQWQRRLLATVLAPEFKGVTM